MAYNPPTKNPGDTILSADWNAANAEVKRLETAKLDHAGGTITGDLTVTGTLNAPKVTAGSIPISGLISKRYAVPLNLPAGQTMTFSDAFDYADSGVGTFLLYFPVLTTPGSKITTALTYVTATEPGGTRTIVTPTLSYTNTGNATLTGTLIIYAVKGQ